MKRSESLEKLLKSEKRIMACALITIGMTAAVLLGSLYIAHKLYQNPGKGYNESIKEPTTIQEGYR